MLHVQHCVQGPASTSILIHVKGLSNDGKLNDQIEGQGLTLQYTRSVAVVVVDLIM